MNAGAPLKPLDREDLADKVRDAILVRASMHGRRPRLCRTDVLAGIDLVLDEVLRVAVARLQNDWDGSKVLQTLYRLRGTRP